MRTMLGLMFGLSFQAAHAEVPLDDWRALPNASYMIHGGSLADRQVATLKDRKLSILIDGRAAKRIFDSIGPDLPATCSDEKGDRARNKKGIYCSYIAQDAKSKEGPYRCWIGLDLATGDSTVTASC